MRTRLIYLGVLVVVPLLLGLSNLLRPDVSFFYNPFFLPSFSF